MDGRAIDLSMALASTGPEAAVAQRNASLRHTPGHKTTTRTIRSPPFTYVCLEIIADTATSGQQPDVLTLRSHIAASLIQFLGLTGSAIAVDILKQEGSICWVRMASEDSSLVLAAIGGWVGSSSTDGKVGWKIRRKGTWLSTLIAQEAADSVWI